MKYYSLILLVAVALNCQGQDTTKKLSRSSVSLAAGANVTYPTGSYLPGGPWGGVPLGSTAEWGSLSYSYLLLNSSHVSFGIKAGIGYAQYKYMGKFAIEVTYGPPILLQQINEDEISCGVFTNIKISKRIGWYNELDIVESWEASTRSSNMYGVNNDVLSNLPYGNYANLFLMYQTGISVSVTRHISLTPLISFPLLNVSALRYQFLQSFNEALPSLNDYSSFRTGLMLKYNF